MVPGVTGEPAKKLFADIKTAEGTIVVRLEPEIASKTVENFRALVSKKYYDGTQVVSVLTDYLVQVGGGAPRPPIDPEEKRPLIFDRAGRVAAASVGEKQHGSQFFILLERAPQLDGKATVFGQVVDGLDIVRGFSRRSRQRAAKGERVDRPVPAPVIKSIKIVERLP